MSKRSYEKTDWLGNKYTERSQISVRVKTIIREK